MKLTNEQQATIHQLVYNEVQYNETYLEVYDHVITALECRNNITDIQKAYAEILEQDFGGHSGLAKMEERQKKLLSQEIKAAKWRAFASLFKLPVLPVTLLVAGSVYYLTLRHLYTTQLILTGIGIMMMPSLFLIAGNFFIGLKKTFIKASMRDDAANLMSAYMGKFMWRLIFLSFGFNMAAKLITHGDELSLFNIPYQIVFSLTFTFCVAHTIAVLMIYRKEYQIRLQP